MKPPSSRADPRELSWLLAPPEDARSYAGFHAVRARLGDNTGFSRGSWLTTFWCTGDWPFVRWIGCWIREQPNSVINPPSAQRPHAVFLANLLKSAICRLSMYFVVQATLSHQLIQRIVNK